MSLYTKDILLIILKHKMKYCLKKWISCEEIEPTTFGISIFIRQDKKTFA